MLCLHSVSDLLRPFRTCFACSARDSDNADVRSPAGPKQVSPRHGPVADQQVRRRSQGGPRGVSGASRSSVSSPEGTNPPGAAVPAAWLSKLQAIALLILGDKLKKTFNMKLLQNSFLLGSKWPTQLTYMLPGGISLANSKSLFEYVLVTLPWCHGILHILWAPTFFFGTFCWTGPLHTLTYTACACK